MSNSLELEDYFNLGSVVDDPVVGSLMSDMNNADMMSVITGNLK